ncbi:hypothetical protein GTGU_04479 [Trabulsiella guamensis ATCC 49490]|uniref:Tail fiber assembly protein n=1 Tax=Trabulsiella guamensis ATCC 49490 TaxID=1005994 RepID=A0A084ZMA1_9ENTR|nr:tail fiber assembly protein [Trabulsiella guamensis]KFB98595.1 hypothetical protein GTGU_04479 [Trabulsiella guamensis ATCC 49490]
MSDFNYSFSPSNCAFYANTLKETYYAPANDWPSDAFEVSDDVTNEFTAQPPNGKKLGVVDGLPVWIDVPPPTQEELTAENELIKCRLRTVADAEIAWRQDAVETGIASGEETAVLAEWKKYRVLLMRVDTAKPEWPTVPDVQAS